MSPFDNPAWKTSQAIPLVNSGSVSTAQVAVSSNATLTVALQSVARPNRVQLIGVIGNPIAPVVLNGEEGVLPVQQQPVGSVDVSEGETVVHFLFEPQSAGTACYTVCNMFNMWLCDTDA